MTNCHNIKKVEPVRVPTDSQKSERGSNSQQGKLVAVECSGKHYKKILEPPRSEQRSDDRD